MRILALPVLTILAGGAAALNPALSPVATYAVATASPVVDHSSYDRLLKKIRHR